MIPGAALVTGAGARLGRAMAEALGADGWSVCVHYRGSKAEAEATAAAIRQSGGRAEILACDLADEASRDGLVAEAARRLGRPVTLLVNSAATFTDDTATEHSRADWDHHLEPNLRAPVHLAQQFAGQLPPGEKGLIVNLIDQRVWKLTPQYYSYTLTKAALLTATRTMAQALAPRIRVNAVGPGPTFPNSYDGADRLEQEAAGTLLGRRIAPEEIAEAALYLARASSVTGQMIAVDAGQHLGWRTPDIIG